MGKDTDKRNRNARHRGLQDEEARRLAQGGVARAESALALKVLKRYVQRHMRDPRLAVFSHSVRVLGVQAERALERDRIHGPGKIT